jgi:hypothetical protein
MSELSVTNNIPILDIYARWGSAFQTTLMADLPPKSVGLLGHRGAVGQLSPPLSGAKHALPLTDVFNIIAALGFTAQPANNLSDVANFSRRPPTSVPDGGIKPATVDITSAQILDQANTPVLLIAAPGANKIIVPACSVQVRHGHL